MLFNKLFLIDENINNIYISYPSRVARLPLSTCARGALPRGAAIGRLFASSLESLEYLNGEVH